MKNVSNLIMVAGITAFAIGAPAFSQQQQTDEEIAARIEMLVAMADPITPEMRALNLEYSKKYSDAIVIDSVVIGTLGLLGIDEADSEFLANHYLENNYTAYGLTATNGTEGSVPLFARLEGMTAWIESNDNVLKVSSVDDIHRAKQEGKVAVIYNSQNSDILDFDVANVQKFYDVGIRQLNFAYNQNNYWADGMSANTGEDNGLSATGEQLVVAMNDAGMVVDCSHSSDRTCIEAAELTSRPMVMSHSNAGGLRDIARNSSDEAIRAVAATGGVICTNFIGGFLNAQGDAMPFSIAKHVEYIRHLVGVQATCLGSDWVVNYGETLDPIIRNPIKYPPEQGYGDPSHYPPPGTGWGVARTLEEDFGWSEAEVRLLLGENLMRVFEANWK